MGGGGGVTGLKSGSLLKFYFYISYFFLGFSMSNMDFNMSFVVICNYFVYKNTKPRDVSRRN